MAGGEGRGSVPLTVFVFCRRERGGRERVCVWGGGGCKQSLRVIGSDRIHLSGGRRGEIGGSVVQKGSLSIGDRSVKKGVILLTDVQTLVDCTAIHLQTPWLGNKIWSAPDTDGRNLGWRTHIMGSVGHVASSVRDGRRWHSIFKHEMLAKVGFSQTEYWISAELWHFVPILIQLVLYTLCFCSNSTYYQAYLWKAFAQKHSKAPCVYTGKSRIYHAICYQPGWHYMALFWLGSCLFHALLPYPW